MKKRIISICLVAALVFAMLPQTAIYSHAAQLDAAEYEMREEVIEFKLSDGTVFYSNTLRYPYFLGNTAAEININKEYAARIQNCRNNATDFDAQYQEILRWSPDELSGLPFYDNLTAEVTYCKNGAISIKECSTMWSGGMHPYSYYSGHTYLIADGSELVLSDILTGSDAQIKNLVDKHKQGVVDYYDAEVIMASPFVLTEDGLCFLCNVGDAVLRAEILIPYSDANSFVISAGHSLENNNGENSDEKDSYTQKSDEKIRTINAINALLVGVNYYPEQHESDVSKWTDEAIRDAIHSKLLWDDYQDSDSSYLSSIGLKYWTAEDWHLHFDLALIQKITRDTFGRDLPISTPVSPSVTTGTVYQSVIDQYLAVLNMDSRTFLKTPDQYWNGDHRAVYYFHRYKSDNFYYACYDIDKNGTDELLVGAGRDTHIAIVDIYGWDGADVVQIMDESTLGDRSRVLLLEDGTMYHSWSNSADETGEEYFRLDGCTLKEGSASTAAEKDNIEWQVFAGPEYNEKNGISNGNSDNMVISGNELLISEAIGESTTLSVQNYTQQGDMLIAVGTAIHNYVGFSEFLGYFQAIVKKNPSSVYGYTLVSFGSIAENQQFSKLKASASSELKEVTITHYAENVIDDNLETVWVEGVPGVGKNEWIKLEAKDGSKMDVSAIEFALGYQKNEKLLRNNGWPYKVLIEGEGGYRQEAEFYEYTDAVILDQPITTSWIKITILEADAGAKYEDTCISEIRLRGMDTTAYFQKFLLDNPVKKPEHGLVIYSDYTNLSIRKGSTITLSAGVLAGSVLTEDASRITFQIGDTSILSVSSSGTNDNCRYVKLRGIDEGTTIVGFTDPNSGYTAEIPVTVYDNNYLSYTLSSVPTQHIDKYPTNVYNVNGLYVDNYKYTIKDNQSATVSFDVYNTNYIYGAVEVYDENGNMTNAVLIEKMASSNTGIKEVLWDSVGCLVRDIIDGDLLSYRQESGYSKRTQVQVDIPQNGYVKICIDPEESFVVGLVNSVDSLMAMASLVGEIKSFDVNSKEFAEKLTVKLLADKVYEELIKDGSKVSKQLWKNVGKETLITSKSMGSFTDTVTKNIDELKLGSIIADTAADFGWNIGENVLTYFFGPVGTALKAVFTIGKVENIIIQQNDLIQSRGTGSIYIQNQGGGIRSCQQIMVESENEFSPDTALNVFEVSFDTLLLDVIKTVKPDVYEAMTNGMTYTYNISLLKNGEETQPDGKVTVYIPIPENLKTLAYAGKYTGELAGKIKVYRVEEDGNLTEMESKIKDGCIVFTTDHFSLYTIVGHSFENDAIQKENRSDILAIGMIAASAVILGAATIVIFKKKKKNK